jgi:hypothetical protein
MYRSLKNQAKLLFIIVTVLCLYFFYISVEVYRQQQSPSLPCPAHNEVAKEGEINDTLPSQEKQFDPTSKTMEEEEILSEQDIREYAAIFEKAGRKVGATLFQALKCKLCLACLIEEPEIG